MPAGTRIQLAVHPFRPGNGLPELDVAVASIWLALCLGGVGQRSRRGAGSLVIESTEPAAIGLPLLSGLENTEALANGLQEGIAAARRTIASAMKRLGAAPAAQSQGSPPSFPMLLPSPPDTRVQVVLLKARDELKARAEVMIGLRKFKNAVFGLPYMKTAPGDKPIKGRDIRHASPLWIHVHPLTDGGFAMVQTMLRSRTATAKGGDWKKMTDYLDSFSNRIPVLVR